MATSKSPRGKKDRLRAKPPAEEAAASEPGTAPVQEPMAMTEGATPPVASEAGPAASATLAESALNLIGRGVVSPVLQTPAGRQDAGLPVADDELGRYMIELNIQYIGGLQKAAEAFDALCEAVLIDHDQRRKRKVSKSYFRIRLTCKEWRTLLKQDEQNSGGEPRKRVVYKLWPDFKVKALMDRSVATVKADAAYRSYAASGAGITWAVIDSGIDGTHPHFGSSDPAQAHDSVVHHPSVAELHRDFTDAADTKGQPLVDGLGHGTHVAGIIAGGLPPDAVDQAGPPADGKVRYAVYEQVFEADADGDRVYGKQPVQRTVRKPETMHGVAPAATLVSLKVLDATGAGYVSDIMEALVYIREELNDDPKMLRVHGVNLSVGYDFDAQMFACGQSPLCVEVDRLVKAGVVVVTAAGNTGYGSVSASERATKASLSNTINDPGNAALAITVGSTHREAPHTYGVSFFSSKGPTGDGRLKPDLVAPGERITSCAAAAKRKALGLPGDDGVAAYVDDSGTSMAAPHVSGAIAAFLSIRREFIQRFEEVKRIFLDSATSLGRERYFEGHGLVDLMRAIQSV
jgi:serine protease AprX